ncbi:MAG: hypothetical protein NTX61_03420 [Bacteroidetes bacterium]|nr:hypothetical protein [Bacteroidota bacterium]
MNDKVFSEINKIIERDNKATTYKFALLRGVIDIIQDNSPYITIYGNKVFIPTGLLIEKWMMYYYPILESQISIPQSNGEKNLSFSIQLQKLISIYKNRHGFIGFYEDLKRNGAPKDLNNEFLLLSKQIYQAITTMPMKHIGYSINHRLYSIFSIETGRRNLIPYVFDVNFLIDSFGKFSIPTDYYQSFKILGSFINGQDSLLLKWAEFSVNASKKRLSQEEVIAVVAKNPMTDRDIRHSKKIFESELKNSGKLYCVWTGDPIRQYEIDHVIPFSVWRNNDLWNLLPTKRTINNIKREKIPTPETIEKHKEQLLYYWEMLDKVENIKFQKEIKVTLLGNNSELVWQDSAIKQLQQNCEYLISERGFEAWNC